MYHGYDIVSSAAFRVTRNSNLYLAEEESRNLLESVRTELHNRRKGDAVRLEIESDADPEIIERLRTNFELEPWQVFSVNGPVNLSRLFNIYEQTAHPELKFKAFIPRELRLTAKSQDLFEELRRHDILLHHPFDAYDAVVSFIESAAQDSRVLSIKQTLYRTNEHSLIVPALIAAAEKKEVTAVVELKARFDEDTNIRWARDLEDAGVQVFHGLVGLKTHCKLSLLVRRDHDGVTRRYAHLGTGNYNASTARIYTDLSLLTADPDITAAVHDVFNFLTAYAEHPKYEPLLVAPLDLAEGCLGLIAREAEHARHGRPAHIIAKMNALLDKNIIMALYRASQAGVNIDLHRPRHVRSASRRARGQRPHSGAQHRGPLPRAQPHFPFRQWRPGRGLFEQRGLDAPQSLRTRRSNVSAEGRVEPRARASRDLGRLPGGQSKIENSSEGRRLRPQLAGRG